MRISTFVAVAAGNGWNGTLCDPTFQIRIGGGLRGFADFGSMMLSAGLCSRTQRGWQAREGVACRFSCGGWSERRS